MQIHTILVPTDFSPCAAQALRRAIALAKHGGGEVHLLHAYELPIPLGFGEPAIALPQEFFDQVRERAQQHLDELAAQVSAEGVKVHTYLTCDAPARAILETAQSLKADLIVMGTRGLTGVKHMLLGSVAERTVRLAPCAVLTVKS